MKPSFTMQRSETREERLFAEGRNAALHNPNAGCPYHVFAEIAAWKRGFDKGAEEADRLSWDELAYARGWHAGFYSPTMSVCPYENDDEVRYWQQGFVAGHDAAARFNKDLGKRKAVESPILAPVQASQQTPTFATKAGRTAKEVTDPNEVKAIWRSYRGNGGNLTYDEIEREFGLRRKNGMTAYHVCHKLAAAN